MKSKCCGAGLSGYGGMTPLGSTKITYFCGACGKPCELTDAKPEGTEAERAAEKYVRSKTPILPGTMDQFTWQQWDDIIREREKNAFLAGHANGEAEGRRREREQIQKEILPEWAEKRLQQREEAAAREAWKAARSIENTGDFSWDWDIWIAMWKQRKSQGGIGL